jgi:hypothetical protein
MDHRTDQGWINKGNIFLVPNDCKPDVVILSVNSFTFFLAISINVKKS